MHRLVQTLHALITNYKPCPILKIQTPGLPTLLVITRLVMFGLRDPGMVTELTPSPALIPAKASVPPSPSSPKESSPVVHCRSAYKKIAKDSDSLVASTH